MSAYKHALVVDDTASDQRIALAAAMLMSCEKLVVLVDVVALRPTPSVIMCEIIDPMPASHRCEEEFKVLVENAKRIYEKSKLAKLLPNKPLQWLVVEDNGSTTTQLWPER